VTLNAFDVRPSCDTADVQAILPFPPNPLKHALCDVPDCGVDGLSQFWCCLWKWWDVNNVLDEKPTGRNHTLSGLVTGVARYRRCCLCPLHDQPIDLAGVHLGHYDTANIPLSNGSNVTYFCSVFVKTWFRKILR